MSRYGIHVTCNGYYLCYDVDMIKKIFNDIRTMNKGQVCLETLHVTLAKVIFALSLPMFNARTDSDKLSYSMEVIIECSVSNIG